MKRFVAFLTCFLLLFVACKKSSTDPRTTLLTASGWGKPAIIEINSGFITINTCPEGSYFNSDGTYQYKSICTDLVTFSGTWQWQSDGSLYIWNSPPGFNQKNSILALNDTILLIRLYQVNPTQGRTDYVGEFKYRHNPAVK